MNLEHEKFETRDDEIDRLMKAQEISTQQSFEAEIEELEKRNEARAVKEASKILRKNKREIARLKTHMEKCIYTNNFVGYEYAVLKLRRIYKIKGSGNDIKVLFNTTRSTLLNMVKENAQKQA